VFGAWSNFKNYLKRVEDLQYGLVPVQQQEKMRSNAAQIRVAMSACVFLRRVPPNCPLRSHFSIQSYVAKKKPPLARAMGDSSRIVWGGNINNDTLTQARRSCCDGYHEIHAQIGSGRPRTADWMTIAEEPGI
jgi:hypothetical protein